MAQLTERQRRFCDEYLTDLNAAKAYVRAGYSAKASGTAPAKLLSHPAVSEFLSERMAEMQSGQIAGQQEVLEYLSRVMRGETLSSCMVVENAGGRRNHAREVQKAPDEKERLKAAELLGKCYGMYRERLDVKGALPVVITGGDQLED